MLEFIEFVLSTLGLTFIITQSYIFNNIRIFILKKNKFLGKLFKCPACMGFWVGMLMKILIFINYNGLTDTSIIIIIVYGFIGSMVSYLTYLFLKPLSDKYD